MSPGRAALGLAVVLIVAVGAWLVGRSDPPSADAGLPASVSEQGIDGNPADLAAVQRTSPAVAPAQVAATGRVAAAEQAPAATGAPGDRALLFEARVVVVELDGTERRDADGELLVEYATPAGEDPEYGAIFESTSGSIAFRGGRLEWRSEESIHYAQLRGARVEGRMARATDGGVDLQLLIDAGAPAELRVAIEAEHWLEVRDRDSGQPLDGVHVLSGAFPSIPGREALPLPNPVGEWVVRDASSPIRLENPVGLSGGYSSARLFVAAEGYAWRYATVDLDAEHHVVELGPGGGLDLALTAAAPHTARLILRRVGATPFYQRVLEIPADLSLDHLPVGEFAVEVRGGGAEHRAAELGAGTVRIVAGERAALRLDLEPPVEEVVPRADIELVLDLDASWSLDLVEGLLDGAEPATAAAGRRWVDCPLVLGDGRRVGSERIEDLPLGLYRLRLFDLGRAESIEVRGDGVYRVEIPAPLRIRIRCVDGRSGAPLDLPQVNVGAVDGEGQVGITAIATRVDAGQFEAAVEPGAIEVYASPSPLHPGYRERFSVAEGAAEVELALPPAHGLRLILRDGGEELEFPPLVVPRLVAVDHGGKATMRARDGEALVCFVTEPGVYDLSLPAIDGYRTPEAQRIDLPEGALIDLALDLLRSE